MLVWLTFLWHVLFCQAEDGIRDADVTGVQTCALPICLHPAIRNPKSAIASRFIVDQRVAAFRKAGPWLDLDDMKQHGALEPKRDLLDGAPQGAPSGGPRGGARVAGEQLQLDGAQGEDDAV